jgi:hypothetical protein
MNQADNFQRAIDRHKARIAELGDALDHGVVKRGQRYEIEGAGRRRVREEQIQLTRKVAELEVLLSHLNAPPKRPEPEITQSDLKKMGKQHRKVPPRGQLDERATGNVDWFRSKSRSRPHFWDACNAPQD